MTPDAILAVLAAYPGVDFVHKDGDTYVFYNPDKTDAHRKFPFVTIVTADRHDAASGLDREGVYRLNIGVSKATYEAHFGPPPPFRTDGGYAETGHDFTQMDKLLPHPVYAAMHWVCVVSPGEATFETVVRPLLAEAYAKAAGAAER